MLLTVTPMVLRTTNARADDTPPVKQNAWLLDNGLDAPHLTPWPDGLPDATGKPDGTMCLPAKLSEQVLSRLRILEVYPAACQDIINANRTYLKDQHSLDLNLCHNNCQLNELETVVETSSGWVWYEVAAVALGTFGVGFFSGFILNEVRR